MTKESASKALAPTPASLYQQRTVPMLMGSAVVLVTCLMVYLAFFDRAPGF